MNARRRTQMVTALLPLLALSATLVQAETPDPKMDACIKAFVDSNLGKDRPVTVRKPVSFDTTVDPNAREQTIHLSARFQASGQLVAHGICTIKGDELVLTTNGKTVQTTKLAQAATTRSSR